jgi:hypothetical protein
VNRATSSSAVASPACGSTPITKWSLMRRAPRHTPAITPVGLPPLSTTQPRRVCAAPSSSAPPAVVRGQLQPSEPRRGSQFPQSGRQAAGSRTSAGDRQIVDAEPPAADGPVTLPGTDRKGFAPCEASKPQSCASYRTLAQRQDDYIRALERALAGARAGGSN